MSQESHAYRFLLSLSTHFSAPVLWEITNPKNDLKEEEGMKQWKNFNECYVTFFQSLSFDVKEKMIKHANKCSFGGWKRCDKEYKKLHPWKDMDYAKVHKGMAALESVTKMIRVCTNLSFMNGLGFDGGALEEFCGRTVYKKNPTFHLLNSMDPLNLKLFIKKFQIL